jgi:hypothetical protein
MRRQFRDALLFLAVPTAVAAVLFVVSERVAPVYPELKAAHDELRAQRGGALAVSLGNSHAKAVDFDALGTPGVRLSRVGADVFESRHLLARAFATAQDVELVLFAVPIGGFAIDNAVEVTPDRPDRRRELYARAGGWRWLPGDFPHFVAGRAAPLTRADHWKRVFFTLAGRTPPQEPDEDADALGGQVAPDALDANAEERVAASVSLATRMLELDPTVPVRAEATLRAAATDACRRGAEIVFYTAPLAPGYLARLPDGAHAEFTAAMRAIAAEAPCARYFDYSDHPDFQAQPALFRNSDHVNAAGARHFSKLLRARIEEDAPPAACAATP